MKIIEKANAKINLTLNVTGKKPNGYHSLKMIMTPLSLHDEVIIEDSDNTEFYCNVNNLLGPENIVLKTIKMIKDKFNINRHVRVTLNKNIPVGAGLGGGSADCAATLRGLNKLWELGLTLEELADIGITLGADVPFCIYNRQAIVSGVGENIEFLNESCFYIILVAPDFGVSTKDVFSNTHNLPFKEKCISKQLAYLEKNNITELKKLLFNDLEEVTTTLKKELSDILLTLKTIDKYFLMTGSGSVLYSIFQNEQDALNVQKQIDKHKIHTIYTSSVCNRFHNLV